MQFGPVIVNAAAYVAVGKVDREWIIVNREEP